MAAQTPFLLLPFLYRRQIGILSAFGILSSVFLLVGPYFSTLFIDRSFLSKDLHNFILFSVWGAAVFIVSILFHTVGEVIRNTLRIRVQFDLASRFMRRFYALDLSFFRARSAGESINRVSDIEGLSNFIIDEWPSLISDIVRLLVIVCIAFWLNVRLTALLVLLSPLFLLQSLYLQKKLAPVYERLWYSSAALSKQIGEAFANIVLIKALGLERFQRHRYLATLIKRIRLGLQDFRWSLAAGLASSFVSKAVYGALSLYGGWLILKGQLSLGTFTAVMIYIAQLGVLLETTSSRFSAFVKENVALQRFWEVMDAYPQIRQQTGAREFALHRSLEIADVRFGYEAEKPVLQGLSLEIPAASWVALVGPSGCGKTTLISLILRLYDPWEGRVLFDGIDVRSVLLGSLRRKVALAPQEPFLFDGSIGENIVYGLRHVRASDIEAAAVTAGLRDFISGLPGKYDTQIGETGCRLSQGLKQRIALARAVIRDPDLLIIDEATSSIDSLTEESILRMLRSRRQGRTTIIVSHRLSTVKGSDMVLFLKDPSTVEQGSHEHLLQTSTSYRAFFQAQLIPETGLA